MNIPPALPVAFIYKHKMTSEVLVVDIDRARELDAVKTILAARFNRKSNLHPATHRQSEGAS
jgi:hypothetical protein